MTSCSQHGVIGLPKAIQAVHVVVCGEVLLATHTQCLLLNTHLVLVIHTCDREREEGGGRKTRRRRGEGKEEGEEAEGRRGMREGKERRGGGGKEEEEERERRPKYSIGTI